MKCRTAFASLKFTYLKVRWPVKAGGVGFLSYTA